MEQGSIFASIEHTGSGDQDEMVSFHDNPNSYDTSESLAILDKKISQAVMVGERLNRQDKTTALDRDFMSRVRHLFVYGCFDYWRNHLSFPYFR